MFARMQTFSCSWYYGVSCFAIPSHEARRVSFTVSQLWGFFRNPMLCFCEICDSFCWVFLANIKRSLFVVHVSQCSSICDEQQKPLKLPRRYIRQRWRYNVFELLVLKELKENNVTYMSSMMILYLPTVINSSHFVADGNVITMNIRSLVLSIWDAVIDLSRFPGSHSVKKVWKLYFSLTKQLFSAKSV